MVKGLICALACNKYPNSPLSGCVEDAEALISMCRDAGWEGPTRLQTDDQVTNNDIRECLNWFITEVNSGKFTNALFLVTGHGTSIPAPGRIDPTRELFCPVDIDYLWRSRELITDEDYEVAFNSLSPSLRGKVKVDFFALCCNSGGLTTTQIDDAAEAYIRDATLKVRYLRNPWEAEIAEYRKTLPPTTRAFSHAAKNLFVDDESIWSYHAACRSNQYSHEVSSALRGRGDVGRLGRTEIWRKNSSISCLNLHEQIQFFIDREYQFDQCPQLWAPTWRLHQDLLSAPVVA